MPLLSLAMFRRMALLYFFSFVSLHAYAGDGKLIGTAGLNQIEGAGGGGLVPWATLSGYDSREQTSGNAFATYVNVDDYRLKVLGASVSLYDRVELSVARHTFDLTTLGPQINQTIIGAKIRLTGDVIYSPWPQISAGVQYKRLDNVAIARSLGSQRDTDVDYYIAATKVHLGAVSGFNLVWNATARYTRANQLGLLGFGGPSYSSHKLMLEGSAALLLSRHVAVGVEYRQKPDLLGLGEEDWKDVFITFIPGKSFNITLAWASLGTIAGAENQSGPYLSIGGQLW